MVKISAAEHAQFILGQITILGLAMVVTLVELAIWLANFHRFALLLLHFFASACSAASRLSLRPLVPQRASAQLRRSGLALCRGQGSVHFSVGALGLLRRERRQSRARQRLR
jgi:hypothetical protein